MAFGLRRAIKIGLIVRVISFHSTNSNYVVLVHHAALGDLGLQTDRQTDGRHAIAILRFAL